jgi:hypothetical protein
MNFELRTKEYSTKENVKRIPIQWYNCILLQARAYMACLVTSHTLPQLTLGKVCAIKICVSKFGTMFMVKFSKKITLWHMGHRTKKVHCAIVLAWTKHIQYLRNYNASTYSVTSCRHNKPINPNQAHVYWRNKRCVNSSSTKLAATNATHGLVVHVERDTSVCRGVSSQNLTSSRDTTVPVNWALFYGQWSSAGRLHSDRTLPWQPTASTISSDTKSQPLNHSWKRS